ncbi:MAG TPA: AsmA-like C-terminal region-containing protein, partial [Puia sp.]|nr:AsmA-like C-terminal region-containing protein [Puia sp.]
IYDKVNYDNVKGTVIIRDESVSLKNVQMDALQGKIAVNGVYSTKKDKKQPDISFSYDLSELDVQKTFLAFNAIQRLMPVGKYISGKINSQLSVNGKLNGDMAPLMTTLTGKGNLLFVEGALEKFAPAEKLAQTLNMSELNGLSLKDVKLFFEFANGKVLIRPFYVKVKEIDMEIGGMHGMNESIDYLVGMKIPRSMLGSQSNALVNNLAQQANSKGIAVKLSDYINLNVKIGGTLTKPTIKTDLGASGADLAADLKKQTEVFAMQAVDSARIVVNDKSKELGDSAKAIKEQAVKDLASDLSNSLSGKKDSTGGSGKSLELTQKNAEKTVQNTLNSLFNKKKKTSDSTKAK